MDIKEGVNSTIYLHQVMFLDDSLYVIIILSKNLITQLISIYVFDSFINGNLQVRSGFIY